MPDLIKAYVDFIGQSDSEAGSSFFFLLIITALVDLIVKLIGSLSFNGIKLQTRNERVYEEHSRLVSAGAAFLANLYLKEYKIINIKKLAKLNIKWEIPRLYQDMALVLVLFPVLILFMNFGILWLNDSSDCIALVFLFVMMNYIAIAIWLILLVLLYISMFIDADGIYDIKKKLKALSGMRKLRKKYSCIRERAICLNDLLRFLDSRNNYCIIDARDGKGQVVTKLKDTMLWQDAKRRIVELRGKTVLVFSDYGFGSMEVCEKLNGEKVDAFNLGGVKTRWTRFARLNYEALLMSEDGLLPKRYC